MNEKNPFVVDDDASIRESLKDLLGSAGLNVETFASAQEFLASQRVPTLEFLRVRIRNY